MRKCPYCAEEIQEDAIKCKHCGEFLDGSSKPSTTSNSTIIVQNKKSRGVAALLAIFLGGIGIHKFYLNRPGWGIIYILFCITFIPAVIGFIEGLIYAFMSNEEFDKKYNIEPTIVKPEQQKVVAKEDRIKCPSCAELIQREAKVCLNCGTQINNQSVSNNSVGLAASSEETMVIGKANTKWDSIKLRMEPNSSSDIVGRIELNTTVDIIRESGDWYQIVTPENSIKGWLWKNSVDLIQDIKDFK